jgi:hypothetical protein
MSATLTAGSSFAAHVHEVIDLDEHGASLRAVERSIDSMSVTVEEQMALRVLASSLHTGANVNQEVTGATGALRSAYAALDIAHATKQAQLGTERWVNEGGSLAPEKTLVTPLRDASALAGEVVAPKWTWHDDLPEVERW